MQLDPHFICNAGSHLCPWVATITHLVYIPAPCSSAFVGACLIVMVEKVQAIYTQVYTHIHTHAPKSKNGVLRNNSEKLLSGLKPKFCCNTSVLTNTTLWSLFRDFQKFPQQWQAGANWSACLTKSLFVWAGWEVKSDWHKEGQSHCLSWKAVAVASFHLEISTSLSTWKMIRHEQELHSDSCTMGASAASVPW